MSMTSWRSLRFPLERALSSMRVRSEAFWRSLARGCMERFSFSSSESISSSLSASESVLRRFTSGVAHSGVGCRRVNCLRSRRTYSLPLTTSSASVLRSLRSLAWLASDTARRSSSLSYHTAGSSSSSSSSASDGVSGDGMKSVVGGAPESRKKS